MDLSTKYLGFDLPHPLVVGASPLIYKLDHVRRLEDAGVAALVMHSLFEEQIVHHQAGLEAHIESHEESFGEATSYFPQAAKFHLGPEKYLEQIQAIKEIVSCPVIASLNGLNEGTWVEYARLIEQAGADALELNLYFLPSTETDSSAVIEQRAFQVIRMVRQFVNIPVAVKISPYFTSLPHFVSRIEEAGAAGVVLFNRFFQPDIDTEELELTPHLELSNNSELLPRLRWLATLYGRTRLNMAVTGGVHSAEDVVKAIMAGADAVQIVSCLLKNGAGYAKTLLEAVKTWLEEHEYESIEQMRGSMSLVNSPNPEIVSRANYMRILQTWEV